MGRSRVVLVARREVVERVRTRSFRITTAVMVVAALAAMIVLRLVGASGPTTYDVGVVGQTSAATKDAIRAGSAPFTEARVHVRSFANEKAAAAAVLSDDVDVALVDGKRLLARDDVPTELTVVLNQAVSEARAQSKLRAVGLSPQEVTAFLAPEPLPVQRLEPVSPAQQANRALVFAGVLLIYLALITHGNSLAAGVVEEKSTRMSEVLLVALRPSELMGGKVVGIGLVGLLQLLCVVVPAAAAGFAVGTLEVPKGTLLTFAAVVLWFILGYGLYSCVYAALAVCVSGPEEVGAVTAPATVLTIVAYFVSLQAMDQPDGLVSRVASFLPPLAPMTMLARAGLGEVAPWEIAVSVALVVLSSYALIRLAGRIYTGAIRHTGTRIKLREAWRSADA